jgi:hypothetical protein
VSGIARAAEAFNAFINLRNTGDYAGPDIERGISARLLGIIRVIRGR